MLKQILVAAFITTTLTPSAFAKYPLRAERHTTKRIARPILSADASAKKVELNASHFDLAANSAKSAQQALNAKIDSGNLPPLDTRVMMPSASGATTDATNYADIEKQYATPTGATTATGLNGGIHGRGLNGGANGPGPGPGMHGQTGTPSGHMPGGCGRRR